MSVKLADRPMENVREEVIDQLIFNYSHGHLSMQAFERRLDQAMSTSDHQQLVELCADLELREDQQYSQYKASEFAPKYAAEEFDDEESIVNIFGGSDRTGQWLVPKRIKVLSIFGGANLDFTDAVFQSPVTRITSFCLFGGENLYVPENVNVVSKVFCIFGGVNNKAPSMAGRHGPKIVLEGFAIFGGIDVKVKRTIKEKFMAFANNLKSLLNSNSPR